MLVCATISAQDTLCVMLTPDEVIYLDFKSNKIIDRYTHVDDLTLNVEAGQVMCLHLFDNANTSRQLLTTFSNGDHIHGEFNSRDNVFFSDKNWGEFDVHVSRSKVIK